MKVFLNISIVFFLIITLSGCFHKNVMKDDADNVSEVVMTSTPEGDVLVMNEEIFQATSKSSKGGFRQTSGYSEFRLTSYDASTGNIINRIELGERDDNFSVFLGVSNSLLWYVSVDKEIGLHSRNPRTLEIVNKQEDIVNSNPFLANNFPEVKWFELNRYYGLDFITGNIMLTDISGTVYILDTKTLKAEKSTDKIEKYKFDENILCSSGKLNTEDYFNLRYENPRRNISFKNKDFKNLNFLEGHFLCSSSRLDVKNVHPEFFDPINKEIQKLINKSDSLAEVLNNFEETETNKRYGTKHWLETDLENSNRNLKYKLDEMKRSQDDFKTIISSDKGIFIYHRSTATDTAKVLISKIMLKENPPSAELLWTTELPDVFFDPAKVYEKGSFDYVFSKGSPNLQTQRAVLLNDKLILVLMLKAVCIDLITGNILWSFTI